MTIQEKEYSLIGVRGWGVCVRIHKFIFINTYRHSIEVFSHAQIRNKIPLPSSSVCISGAINNR